MSAIEQRPILVPDPQSGELVDVADAPVNRLAEMIQAAGEVLQRVVQIERAIAEELVARMDRAATWTLRDGPYKVSAPSPTAGRDDYPPDELEEALRELIDEGVISEQGADKALRRRLLVEFAVPWGLVDLNVAAKKMESVTLTFENELLVVASAEAARTVSKSGIGDLRKVSGTAEKLDPVKLSRAPTTRKVKVERP